MQRWRGGVGVARPGRGGRGRPADQPAPPAGAAARGRVDPCPRAPGHQVRPLPRQVGSRARQRVLRLGGEAPCNLNVFLRTF